MDKIHEIRVEEVNDHEEGKHFYRVYMEINETIKIIGKNNEELAIGLSSFSSNEISKIKGHQSNKIQELLGYKSKSEVIHKDDMVEI